MVEGKGVVGVREEGVGAAKVAICMVGRSFYEPKGWSERSGKTLARDGKVQTTY